MPTEPTVDPLEKAPSVVGAEQVQATIDGEEEKGYRGHVSDPTPNEHYTLAGVVAGKPTPETDPVLAEKAYRATGPFRNNG